LSPKLSCALPSLSSLATTPSPSTTSQMTNLSSPQRTTISVRNLFRSVDGSICFRNQNRSLCVDWRIGVNWWRYGRPELSRTLFREEGISFGLCPTGSDMSLRERSSIDLTAFAFPFLFLYNGVASSITTLQKYLVTWCCYSSSIHQVTPPVRVSTALSVTRLRGFLFGCFHILFMCDFVQKGSLT
ncbi:hypothetical protein KC19_1G326800, partial [Ceratodon purpureus]